MKVVKLSQDYSFKTFDCGNSDLNDFLYNDSKEYMQKRLAVTYVIEQGEDIAGYFSVLNDKLTVNEVPASVWRKIKKLFSHRKHRSDYPAVKVGRLAVDVRYQGNQIGSDILNFVKQMFCHNNRTGCLFITVDAFRDALPFYFKNGFQRLDTFDLDNSTIQLYYDLNQLDVD